MSFLVEVQGKAEIYFRSLFFRSEENTSLSLHMNRKRKSLFRDQCLENPSFSQEKTEEVVTAHSKIQNSKIWSVYVSFLAWGKACRSALPCDLLKRNTAQAKDNEDKGAWLLSPSMNHAGKSIQEGLQCAFMCGVCWSGCTHSAKHSTFTLQQPCSVLLR